MSSKQNDSSVIVNIPLKPFKTNTEFSFPCNRCRHQLRLIRYTNQLTSLINTHCEPGSSGALSYGDVKFNLDNHDHNIIENTCWAIGELVNNLYQLRYELSKPDSSDKSSADNNGDNNHN